MNLCIKLIQVGDSFKALVLDMNKSAERLVYICEASSSDDAYDDAEKFVNSLKAVTWH